MESAGAEALALYIKAVDSVEVLDVSCNAIECDGISALC